MNDDIYKTLWDLIGTTRPSPFDETYEGIRSAATIARNKALSTGDLIKARNIEDTFDKIGGEEAHAAYTAKRLGAALDTGEELIKETGAVGKGGIGARFARGWEGVVSRAKGIWPFGKPVEAAVGEVAGEASTAIIDDAAKAEALRVQAQIKELAEIEAQETKLRARILGIQKKFPSNQAVKAPKDVVDEVAAISEELNAVAATRTSLLQELNTVASDAHQIAASVSKATAVTAHAASPAPASSSLAKAIPEAAPSAAIVEPATLSKSVAKRAASAEELARAREQAVRWQEEGAARSAAKVAGRNESRAAAIAEDAQWRKGFPDRQHAARAENAAKRKAEQHARTATHAGGAPLESPHDPKRLVLTAEEMAKLQPPPVSMPNSNLTLAEKQAAASASLAAQRAEALAAQQVAADAVVHATEAVAYEATEAAAATGKHGFLGRVKGLFGPKTTDIAEIPLAMLPDPVTGKPVELSHGAPLVELPSPNRITLAPHEIPLHAPSPIPISLALRTDVAAKPAAEKAVEAIATTIHAPAPHIAGYTPSWSGSAIEHSPLRGQLLLAAGVVAAAAIGYFGNRKQEKYPMPRPRAANWAEATQQPQALSGELLR